MGYYEIKRIEAEDNIADLTKGLALIIPEYNYDLLLGFTYQKSGAETFRICKYRISEGKIRPKANIDFAKTEDKIEILAKILEALDEIIEITENKRYQNFREINIKQFSDSSLKSGISSNILYSVCYYENKRHFGFCFWTDKHNDFYLRFFRVDTSIGDTYPESARKQYYAEHRWFKIQLNNLNEKEFLQTFIELGYEILGILEEEDTHFYDYPKYKG
ncbi:MAG: hypothetical protein ACTSP3_14060 [Candidatus Heimdallarchaeaceae archaeon]